jgi:hypothetical protein
LIRETAVSTEQNAERTLIVQNSTAQVVVTLKRLHYKCHNREVEHKKENKEKKCFSSFSSSSSSSCSCSSSSSSGFCSSFCKSSSEEAHNIKLCTSKFYTVVNANPTGVQVPITVKIVAHGDDSINYVGDLVLQPGKTVTLQNYKSKWYLVNPVA